LNKGKKDGHRPVSKLDAFLSSFLVKAVGALLPEHPTTPGLTKRPPEMRKNTHLPREEKDEGQQDENGSVES
jgi:hypothetical protein